VRRRQAWFDLNDAAVEDPAVAILGLPYDGSASRLAGAAAAPGKLREIALTSDPITRRGILVADLPLRDYGDITPAAGVSQRAFLEAAGQRIASLPAGAFPLLIGGDNSVSIAGLTAFARRHGEGAGVIWFDAHPDLFEAYDGNPDSHACALRRAMTLSGIRPGNVILLGTRSWSKEELEHMATAGIEAVTAADCASTPVGTLAGRIGSRLSSAAAVYFAVDIDGFDASCAPGTGYPMPAGVMPQTFFPLMERLFETLPIRAMDVTEVAPALDSNDVTAFLAAQVILETLGALCRGNLPAAHP